MANQQGGIQLSLNRYPCLNLFLCFFSTGLKQSVLRSRPETCEKVLMAGYIPMAGAVLNPDAVRRGITRMVTGTFHMFPEQAAVETPRPRMADRWHRMYMKGHSEYAETWRPLTRLL